MRKKLFDHRTIVMSATVVGYFYNYGKRYDKCRHTGCGFERIHDTRCYYAQPDYNGKRPSHHQNCTPEWCVSNNGARPAELPVAKSVKCKKTYFRAYTPQELANPKTKVEIVAVQVDVAQEYQPPYTNLVAIYNLMKDKWHSSDWWSLTGKGDLAERDFYLSAPSTVAGMDDVIMQVKAGI